MNNSLSIPDRARFQGFAWVRPSFVGLPLYVIGVMGGAALMGWGTFQWPTGIVVTGWVLWGAAGAIYLYLAAGPPTRRRGRGSWDRAAGVVQWRADTQFFDGAIIKIERGYPGSKRAIRWFLPTAIVFAALEELVHHSVSTVSLWALGNAVIVGVMNWISPVYRWVIHVQGPEGRARLHVVQMDTDIPLSS